MSYIYLYFIKLFIFSAVSSFTHFNSLKFKLDFTMKLKKLNCRIFPKEFPLTSSGLGYSMIHIGQDETCYKIHKYLFNWTMQITWQINFNKADQHLTKIKRERKIQSSHFMKEGNAYEIGIHFVILCICGFTSKHINFQSIWMQE